MALRPELGMLGTHHREKSGPAHTQIKARLLRRGGEALSCSQEWGEGRPERGAAAPSQGPGRGSMAQSEGGTGAWRGPRREGTNPRTSRTRRRKWTSSWGACTAEISAQERGMTGSEHQGWELGGTRSGDQHRGRCRIPD